jgi:hypothetical protein
MTSILRTKVGGVKGSSKSLRFRGINSGFLSSCFIPFTCAAPTTARTLHGSFALSFSEVIHANLAAMSAFRSGSNTCHIRALDAYMFVHWANCCLVMSISHMLAFLFPSASTAPMNSHLCVHVLFFGQDAQLLLSFRKRIISSSMAKSVGRKCLTAL